MEKITKLNASLKLTRLGIRFVILLITIVTVGIPTMFNTFKSNVDNAKNNYGIYTLEEIKTSGIQDPVIDKIASQKAYYESYFAQKFSDVELEESISYLKSGISANYIFRLRNNSINYTLQVWTDENNKLKDVLLHFNTGYNGNVNDSFKIIDKEEIEHICNNFEIKNSYSKIEQAINSINETNTSTRLKDGNVEYRVYASEHFDPNVNTNIVNYYVDKDYWFLNWIAHRVML